MTFFQRHILGLHYRPLSLEEIQSKKSHIPYEIVHRDVVRDLSHKTHTQLVDLNYARGTDCIVADEENGFYVVGPEESVIFVGRDSGSNGLSQTFICIYI